MKNYLRGTSQERLARLSKKQQNGDCILFTGHLNTDGYGRFWHNKTRYLAHRAAYEIFCGPIPDDLQVCHRCDTPACVNPDHLFLGTQDDNIRDMVAKGRQNSRNGVHHNLAKLNPEKAFEIRWYAAMGRKHKDIAAEYGVTRPLVSMIVRGELWKPEIRD